MHLNQGRNQSRCKTQCQTLAKITLLHLILAVDLEHGGVSWTQIH